MSSTPRNMMRALRTRRDAMAFPTRFARYMQDGQREPEDHARMLAAFLTSGGEALEPARSLVSETIGSADFTGLIDGLGLARSPGVIDNVVASLEQDGYAVLPSAVPGAMVQELIERCSKAECLLVSDDPTVDGKTGVIDLSATRAEKYKVPTTDLLSSETVRALLTDQALLRIAQGYLGSTPVIDTISAWYSLPSVASSAAGQLFHFDFERVKWLKAFIFLTEVTPDTGAHVFLPGSHRNEGIPRSLRAMGYVRQSDEDVDAFYPREQWQTMVGPPGTILFEDTRGLHRGLPLARGHRLVLEFQYAQSMFGAESHLVAFRDVLTEIAGGSTALRRTLDPLSI